MGNRWLDDVQGADRHQERPLEDDGPQAADYFAMIAKTNAGAKYYFGIPIQVMSGKPKEVFTQVFNNAFPAGTHQRRRRVKQMTPPTDARPMRGSAIRPERLHDESLVRCRRASPQSRTTMDCASPGAPSSRSCCRR